MSILVKKQKQQIVEGGVNLGISVADLLIAYEEILENFNKLGGYL